VSNGGPGNVIIKSVTLDPTYDRTVAKRKMASLQTRMALEVSSRELLCMRLRPSQKPSQRFLELLGSFHHGGVSVYYCGQRSAYQIDRGS
jgi:hypothetical protein